MGWPNNHVRGCIIEELLVGAANALVGSHLILATKYTPQDTASACAETTHLQYQS